MNLSELNWTVSSRCESGHCVAVAITNNHVHVGNSTDPAAGTLTYTRNQWETELRVILRDGLPWNAAMDLETGTYEWTRGGKLLRFTRDEMDAFVAGVLNNEFDLPESSHVG